MLTEQNIRAKASLISIEDKAVCGYIWGKSCLEFQEGASHCLIMQIDLQMLNVSTLCNFSARVLENSNHLLPVQLPLLTSWAVSVLLLTHPASL